MEIGRQPKNPFNYHKHYCPLLITNLFFTPSFLLVLYIISLYILEFSLPLPGVMQGLSTTPRLRSRGRAGCWQEGAGGLSSPNPLQVMERDCRWVILAGEKHMK